MSSTLVLLVRCSESDLTQAEREGLAQAFPGVNLQFERIDPVDYLEHARICQERQPLFVLLREKPLPSQAMADGVMHVVHTPYGFRRLVAINPEFASL